MDTKKVTRLNRHRRIRAKIKGTEARPRLVVFRSLKYNYAQLINDETGKVIVSASDMKDESKTKKIETAKKVGETVAKKAKEKGIESCVFDRNGYKYHGRIKAIADSARENGLKF